MSPRAARLVTDPAGPTCWRRDASLARLDCAALADFPIATPGGTDVQHPDFMNQPVGDLPSETRQRKQWFLGAGWSGH